MYAIEDLKRRYKELGFTWLTFNIIGVRSKAHIPDKFQDLVYVVWGEAIYCFTATTIPGVHWLQKPMNKNGTAIVMADRQYLNSHALGLHKGKKALVQVGDLMVYRDGDGDNLAEFIGEPSIASPECRIDIHGTGPSVVSVLIGAWSAGCQVINNPKEYEAFIGLCEKYVEKKFTYTLLNEFDVVAQMVA